ncbi:MAG: hypothetical protein K2X93_19380 [Candidatus Obscuribacterales bacterium]|nr:hypothetical protein [Candidatus Obscuribacterales bacterium]
MIDCSGGRRKNKRIIGESITEFGSAFYAFCIVIMIPTLNILSFASGYSYCVLCASVTADQVAHATTPNRAYEILRQSASKMTLDPIAKLLKVRPSKDAFGLSLAKLDVQGRNQIVANGIKDISALLRSEQSKGVLQYQVIVAYVHEPLLEVGSVPIVNQIPIVGKETPLAFTMRRHPEH